MFFVFSLQSTNSHSMTFPINSVNRLAYSFGLMVEISAPAYKRKKERKFILCLTVDMNKLTLNVD